MDMKSITTTVLKASDYSEEEALALACENVRYALKSTGWSKVMIEDCEMIAESDAKFVIRVNYYAIW